MGKTVDGVFKTQNLKKQNSVVRLHVLSNMKRCNVHDHDRSGCELVDEVVFELMVEYIRI